MSHCNGQGPGANEQASDEESKGDNKEAAKSSLKRDASAAVAEDATDLEPCGEDEPAVKKARDAQDDSKQEKPVEEAAKGEMVLSGTMELGKVTISAGLKSPTMGTPPRPMGVPSSVTVTKKSTGVSQSVETRDLKSLLVGGQAETATNGTSSDADDSAENSAKKAVKKSPNSYSVEMHKKQKKVKHRVSGGDSSSPGDAQCSKSKEALAGHSADGNGRTGNSDRSSATSSTLSSSPASSLSRGSSRSNSPLFNQSAAAPEASQAKKTPPAKPATASEAKFPSEVKLIKDNNSLMIEGRPKLTISKVNHKTIDTKTGLSAIGGFTPAQQGGGGSSANICVSDKKLVTKVKLPVSTTITPSSSSASSSAADLFNFTEDDRPQQPSMKKKTPPSQEDAKEPSFTGKLKIKLPLNAGNNHSDPMEGVPKKIPTPLSSGGSGGKRSDEEGPPAFAFAGKPTYSPSMVEPSATSMGGKGEQN